MTRRKRRKFPSTTTENGADSQITALEQVKADLKQVNSQVQVSQEEYDEIMAIKPLFLINDYQ